MQRNCKKDYKKMVTTVSKYYKDLEKIPVVNSPRNGFLKEAMPNMFSRSPRRSAELINEYYGKCIHNSTHWQSHILCILP